MQISTITNSYEAYAHNLHRSETQTSLTARNSEFSLAEAA